MNIEFSGWPRASRGRMITLEGADGAGKSTLAVRVADNLALRRNVRFQRRKDYLPDHPIVSKAMRGVSVLLWDRGDCHGDNELPPAYWLHLQAAWHAASYHSYIEPALSQGQTILLDGWYYKFYAKMLLGKYTPDELNLFFSDAGQPDIVILLDRDLNEVWENARRFNHSELGLHEGYEQLGKDSFLPSSSNSSAPIP